MIKIKRKERIRDYTKEKRTEINLFLIILLTRKNAPIIKTSVKHFFSS